MSTAEIIAELPKLSLEELALVQAKIGELIGSASPPTHAGAVTHPALGIWKNRTGLPEDPVAASKLLRERMLKRADTAES